MSVFLYNIFLLLFRAGTAIAALFDPKAKKWVSGRKNFFSRMRNAIPPGEKIIWVHCASLGEFEQGRPVMEELKKNYPAYKILLTFFSPSGYESQKNYAGADWIFYLPLDGPRTAKRFLEITDPQLVIFVKYEFWYYYLKKIKYRNIPLILISALFRRDMSFFKWYGGLQRKILSRFDRLFVQNESSKKLLEEIGLGSITEISGDTRFDRVKEIAEKAESIESIEQFVAGKKLIVAGSTWKEDENMLQGAIEFLSFNKIKLVIAPHEIDEKHIKEIVRAFPSAITYSSWIHSREGDKEILIIDNIGMLSRLYRYAWCSFVGGGFSATGVHNVLEAAVYSKPVFFGPGYHKYAEAKGLVSAAGAIPVESKDPFIAVLNDYILQPDLYRQACDRAGTFVNSHTGAVKKIIRYIQEKRLLIS